MSTYIGLVSKEDDTAYGIYFPDAPGCFSAADTLDDVFAKANEALTEWLALMKEQGHPIPVCRDLSALQGDRTLEGSWADAALVIAVPVPSIAPDAEAA
jgi:predicted RNase H-like HicB family nuclease